MTLVFLLEEKSMKYFLDGILPRIIPEEVEYITVPHEGKSDLRKSIPAKLKGWNMPDVKFVIVQDQDSNDCCALKKELLDLCRKSGDKECLVRIACHELEAWYFGDLDAVSQAYGKDLNWVRRKAAYRIPDNIINPKRELQKFLPEHQQISGAKKIAEYIDIESNTSESFRIFVSGIRSMVEGEGNSTKFPLQYDYE